MQTAVWEPREGDVCVPRDKAGYTAYVIDSSADRVIFAHVIDGEMSNSIVNRLSTFIGRFELLHRPGGSDE